MKERAGVMAQEVKYLPNKCKALSSQSTAKKKIVGNIFSMPDGRKKYWRREVQR
jgi:hypothetical protein